MTPKEKARQLLESMMIGDGSILNWTTGEMEYRPKNQYYKECALRAVNEIISSREEDGGFDDTLSSTSSEYYTPHPMYLTYWVKVKQEIKNL